jgi:hypothetical protein
MIRDRLGLAMIDGRLGVCQGGPGPGDPGENVVLWNPRPGVAIDELGNVVETK